MEEPVARASAIVLAMLVVAFSSFGCGGALALSEATAVARKRRELR